MPGSPARGRRPGDARTRELILSAAREAFADNGFDRATIRGIGARAGVDPALVHHYFGRKEQLFAAAMQLPADPSELIPRLIAAGPDGLGERLVRQFLTVWDSAEGRGAFLGLIRGAVGHEQSAAMLREFVSHAVIGRITAALDVDQPAYRATLAGSQLIGLAMARYVLQLEPLASAPGDEVVAAVGPTLQRYLTEPLGQ